MKNRTLLMILTGMLVALVIFFMSMLMMQVNSMNHFNRTKEQVLDITLAFTDVFAANATLTNTVDPFLYRETWKKAWIMFSSAYTEFDKDLGQTPGIRDNSEIKEQRVQIARILTHVNGHVETIEKSLDKLQEANPDYAPALLEAASNGQKEFKDTIILANTLGTYLNELFYDRLLAMFDVINQVSRTEQKQLQLITIILSTIVSIIMVVFLVFLSRRITKNIERLSSAMGRIKERDLSATPDVSGTDEIAEVSTIFRDLVIDLRAIFASIKKASDLAETQRKTTTEATHESAAAINEVHSNIASINTQIELLIRHIERSIEAVSRINGSIKELSQNTVAQDVAISQSTSAIEEIEASIANIAKITELRKIAVLDLERQTMQNGTILDDTVVDIIQNAQDTARIQEILEVIDGIAGQTNLLSMNAAIEAAHAGNAGKGFAVVADEIGKLADSTNEHATEIRTFINAMTMRVDQIQKKTEEVSGGFKNIVLEMKETASSMTEISSTISELSQGSNEIMTAMVHLRDRSKDIRTNAERVTEESSNVEDSITKVGNAGDQVSSGMKEIGLAISDINNSIAAINDMHAENDSAMETLATKASVFKIEREGAKL